MIQIEKIEINYFRSIYKVKIKDLSHLNVFSGKNDCGKSNILRALNLFFNNETGWKESFDFQRDFSKIRLEECRKSVKGKQFIKITLHFNRGKRYESLPERFWITRTWNRDSNVPSETNSIREGKHNAQSLASAQASLQKYLNTIKFEYIPAIKDRKFFNYSLGTLQEAVLQSRSNKSVSGLIKSLNESVVEEILSLKEEFSKVSNIDVDIQLPENLAELFRAFAVTTGGGSNLPLDVRGDGIQARFLPSLLYHVAKNSKKYFIWGYEEPENCLEYSFANKLASDMIKEYSEDSQIIVTSHSPAFIHNASERSKVYRIFKNEEITEIEAYDMTSDALQEDLGLIQLQKKYQEEVNALLEKETAANKILKDEVKKSSDPILLVEGKTDVIILECAWKKLYPDSSRNFRIISCDTSSDPVLSKAGGSILAKALQACRLDMPKTIGLFDYDEGGIKEFTLDKNFIQDSTNSAIKISTNEHVASLLIPDPGCKKDYMNAKNLLIEFLFPENCITKKVDGKGLVLESQKKITKVGQIEIEQELSHEPHFRKIIKGKAEFAEKVVPTFSTEHFENFRPLFELINQLFDKLR